MSIPASASAPPDRHLPPARSVFGLHLRLASPHRRKRSRPGSGRLAGCALAAAVLAGGVACARPSAIDDSRLVDLTHPLGERTIFWPTEAPFQLEIKAAGRTPPGYWYAANRFCTAEHGGTHLDAPYHFAEHGQKVDQIPIAKLVGPACVIDVSEQAEKDPDYRATVEDLERWEERNGRLPAGAIVLLRTGWSQRWGSRRDYLGEDTPGDASRLHFPGFSKELAEFLVRERRIDAVGIDTASIDSGPSTDFIAHQVLFAADIPAFENLDNLGALPEKGATLIALPARIEGGTGAPLRTIALLP